MAYPEILDGQRAEACVLRDLNYKGKKHLLQVVRVCSIGIRRHIKIKADANPYMPEYAYYFWRRRHDKEARLLGALSARAYRAMIAQEV